LRGSSGERGGQRLEHHPYPARVRSSRWLTSQMGKRTGGTSSSTRTMPGVSRAISSIIAPMPSPCCTSAQCDTECSA